MDILNIAIIALFIIGTAFVRYIIYRYEHILDDDKDDKKSKSVINNE